MTDADREEREFQRLYGPWATTTPAQAAALFEGFSGRWWISGGWAVEAFTGVVRPHKDVDVTIFRRDVAALREHFSGRYDLWAVGSGALRPLDDQRPRIPSWSGQVWVREHALAPWLVDVQLNPGGPRRWVFKRDRTVVRSFDEATWVAPDGLRYLRPELVLAHKARLHRFADDADLTAALPKLDDASRSALRSLVVQEGRDHPWLAEIDGLPRKKSVRAGDPRHERSSVARP